MAQGNQQDAARPGALVSRQYAQHEHWPGRCTRNSITDGAGHGRCCQRRNAVAAARHERGARPEQQRRGTR